MVFMNFINAIISSNSDSLPVAERMEGKKYLFNFTDTLAMHKIIYALFLDSYKSQSGEEEALQKFTSYEYFAGSLTFNRVGGELDAFLKSTSSSNLHFETRKQLEEVVILLKESQELSDHIDFIRSSSLWLIFQAATGMGASITDKDLAIDPQSLQHLVDLARKKVGSLQEGQKAIFLMGTIIHETVLLVERKDHERFELRYYDSAEGIDDSYLIDCNLLLDERFWGNLYASKFSNNSVPTRVKIKNEFNVLEIVEPDKRDRLAILKKQRKNTCHFRCLFTFLKDQIIRKSPLDLESAYLEYNLFKERFGEFLLKSEHLQDLQLLKFSQNQQKKRTGKAERVVAFQNCIAEGKAQETLEAYHSIMRSLGPCFHFHKEPQDRWNSGNLIRDLLKTEKELLEMMEYYLVSPEDLLPFFEKIDNSWVQNSFKLFEERFVKREKGFKKILQEELADVSSEFNLQINAFKHSTIGILKVLDDQLSKLASSMGTWHRPIQWKRASQEIPRTPLDEKEVQDLLNLFESHPEWLDYIDEKPCLLTVLIQAIQLGKIEQVERIYQKLPEKDQKQFITFCNDKDVFFPPKLPESVKEYILGHPDSPFGAILSTSLCLKALHHKQFPEFLKLAHALSSHTSSKMGKFLAHLEIPAEQILDTLFTLRLLSEGVPGTGPYSHEIFSCIGRSLLKQEDTDLLEQIRELNIPELIPILNQVDLFHLYPKGRFKQIDALLQRHNTKMVSPALLKMHFPFDLENYQEGIALMEKVKDPSFYFIIFRDLLKSAYQHRSKEILHSTVASHYQIDESSDLISLGYDTLFFIAQSLLPVLKRWKKNIIKALIHCIDSKEAFEETSQLLESLQLKYPFRSGLIPLYKYLDPLNTTFLAKAVRIQRCSYFFTELIYSVIKYLNGEECNYLRNRKQFLNVWRSICNNSNLSDPDTVYNDWIKPVFQREVRMIGFSAVILDLLKDTPSPETFRLLFARLCMESNERDEALKIFPDKEKLDEAFKKQIH